MAAPGALNLEEEMQEVKAEIKDMKKKLTTLEEEIEGAKKKPGYENDLAATKDLARKEEILLELLRKELELLRKEARLEEKLLRSQGGAGPGPGSTSATGVTPMAKFRQLLSELPSIDERVLNKAAEHFASTILVLEDDVAAVRLYEKVKRMPATSTIAQLKVSCDTAVDGPFLGATSSRSVFMHAFQAGKPKVLKIPYDGDAAGSEAHVWQLLKGKAIGDTEPPHLVGPISLVTLESHSNVAVRSNTVTAKHGILLPHYPCTLAHLPLLEGEALLRVGKEMEAALHFMHGCGLCHCDVKASNVFMDSNGACCLGDYGATVRTGESLSECTPSHMKVGADVGKTLASPALDRWQLAITLLAAARLIEVDGTVGVAVDVARAAAERIEDGECRRFVLSLLN